MAQRSGCGLDLLWGCGLGFAIAAILLIAVVVIGTLFFYPLNRDQTPVVEVAGSDSTSASNTPAEVPGSSIDSPTPLPASPPTTTPLPTETWTPTWTPTVTPIPTDTPVPPTATPVPTPTPLPAPVVVQPVYQMGMDIFVPDVRWRILSAQSLGSMLPATNQFNTVVTTSGKFVQVRFEVENRSNNTQTFSGFSLLDNRGRFFVENRDTDVVARIPDAENCYTDTLNPNVSRSCTAIYEVAADATGLKANIGELRLLDTQQVLVELGQ